MSTNTVQNVADIVYNEAFLSMTTIICYKCGVPFAMPERLRKHFKDSCEVFHCPNGHGQCYRCSTEQQLKNQIERERQEAERNVQRLQTSIEYRDKSIGRLKKEVNSERGRANFHAGKRKIIEARIAHGVCPHCNRIFEDLAKHMECKHPEETAKR